MFQNVVLQFNDERAKVEMPPDFHDLKYTEEINVDGIERIWIIRDCKLFYMLLLGSREIHLIYFSIDFKQGYGRSIYMTQHIHCIRMYLICGLKGLEVGVVQ